MATTPPGWYDDAHGALRWWDGAQWTEHVVAPDPETDADAPTEAEIVASSGSADAPLPAETAAATALGVGMPPAAGVPGYPADATQAGGVDRPVAAAHPDHPQGAYPGGYPGEGGATGIFTAATSPRKSKLWNVWVVLGVVMLALVIGAAVLIPVLLGMNAGGGSSGAASSSPEPPEVAYEHTLVSIDGERVIDDIEN